VRLRLWTRSAVSIPNTGSGSPSGSPGSTGDKRPQKDFVDRFTPNQSKFPGIAKAEVQALTQSVPGDFIYDDAGKAIGSIAVKGSLPRTQTAYRSVRSRCARRPHRAGGG